VETLTLREVIAEEERKASNTLEKCRYAPELLSHPDVEERLRLVRTLHRLEAAGFKHLTKLPCSEPSKPAHHPLPEEVWEVYSIIGDFNPYTTYESSGNYLVHVGEGYAVVVEEYGDVPNLLQEPLGTEVIQGLEFTLYGREALIDVDWYLRNYTYKFNLRYRRVFTLNHDIYLLTKAPPANTRNFPPLLFFSKTWGLFGQAICVANPIKHPPAGYYKIPVDSWLEHIFEDAAHMLAKLGNVWAFTPHELLDVGKPVEIGPNIPIDILAARRALKNKGVETMPCYVGGGSLGLFINHSTSNPPFPIFITNGKPWYYMLTPYEGVSESVKPAKLVFENNRVVVVDEEEIRSLLHA
jgi:hypothetical protein